MNSAPFVLVGRSDPACSFNGRSPEKRGRTRTNARERRDLSTRSYPDTRVTPNMRCAYKLVTCMCVAAASHAVRARTVSGENMRGNPGAISGRQSGAVAGARAGRLERVKCGSPSPAVVVPARDQGDADRARRTPLAEHRQHPVNRGPCVGPMPTKPVAVAGHESAARVRLCLILKFSLRYQIA
jgi:hypothetical protein